MADGDDSVLVTGDLVVHMIQLLHPELAYDSDTDPERARTSRRRVLAEAAERGSVLAVSHLGSAFRPVATEPLRGRGTPPRHRTEG